MLNPLRLFASSVRNSGVTASVSTRRFNPLIDSTAVPTRKHSQPIVGADVSGDKLGVVVGKEVSGDELGMVVGAEEPYYKPKL